MENRQRGFNGRLRDKLKPAGIYVNIYLFSDHVTAVGGQVSALISHHSVLCLQLTSLSVPPPAPRWPSVKKTIPVRVGHFIRETVSPAQVESSWKGEDRQVL